MDEIFVLQSNLEIIPEKKVLQTTMDGYLKKEFCGQKINESRRTTKRENAKKMKIIVKSKYF